MRETTIFWECSLCGAIFLFKHNIYIRKEGIKKREREREREKGKKEKKTEKGKEIPQISHGKMSTEEGIHERKNTK